MEAETEENVMDAKLGVSDKTMMNLVFCFLAVVSLVFLVLFFVCMSYDYLLFSSIVGVTGFLLLGFTADDG